MKPRIRPWVHCPKPVLKNTSITFFKRKETDMNTIGLIGGLLFAVIAIVFLSKNTSPQKKESQFTDDFDEL